MRSQGIAISRRLSNHRYQFVLVVALVVASALLAVTGPFLLALATWEWKIGKRRRRLVGIALVTLIARAIRWLWQELRGSPHGRWHACAQCGYPIEEPSRAAYCSHACRCYARLERDALDTDPRIAERAERRLRALRLRAIADGDPALVEVPF
jgi:hypothetical protein